MIDRHLDAEEKDSLYVDDVCNLFSFFCLLQGCTTANFGPLLMANFFMVSNFSVDQVGLYINWTNTSLFTILGKLSTLNLPIKYHLSLRRYTEIAKIFIFVSNLLIFGCKDNIYVNIL